MTTTPALLSASDVERLELDARADLISAVATIARLRDGSAHVVAGYVTWGEYLLARFGDLLAELYLAPVDRQAAVLRLRLDRLSQRAIAAKLGVALGTVSADLRVLREAGQLDDEPTTVVSGDGRDRPARGASQPDTGALVATAAQLELLPPTGRVYQQAAEWLRRAGDAGLTLVELAEVAGWTEGKASGALSYLTAPARALAVRLDDERAAQRVHVLTAAGRVMLAAIAPAPAEQQPAACSAVGEAFLVLEVAG